jgi:hypothetical protein
MDPHAGKTIGDWPAHPSHMSLFLDPSIAATTLVYTSPTTTLITSTRSNSPFTATQLA